MALREQRRLLSAGTCFTKRAHSDMKICGMLSESDLLVPSARGSMRQRLAFSKPSGTSTGPHQTSRATSGGKWGTRSRTRWGAAMTPRGRTHTPFHLHKIQGLRSSTSQPCQRRQSDWIGPQRQPGPGGSQAVGNKNCQSASRAFSCTKLSRWAMRRRNAL